MNDPHTIPSLDLKGLRDAAKPAPRAPKALTKKGLAVTGEEEDEEIAEDGAETD